MENTKRRIIAIALTVFFATTLLAQVPNGTYLPCNELAKNMYIEKIVFAANKVQIYYGTMGISIGAEEYLYTINQSKPNNINEVGFEYDKTSDKIIFGKALINAFLGQLSNQLNFANQMNNTGNNTNSAELGALMGNANEGAVYNKSGNCNSNTTNSNNSIWITIIDPKQKSIEKSTEIINNYLIVPDNNNIIPRLDKEKAIKSGKYTSAEIAEATKLLHDEIDAQLRGIFNKINAANLILSFIGDNAVGIVNGIAEIKSLFSIPDKIVSAISDPKSYVKGKFQNWILNLYDIKFPTVGEVVGPDISRDMNSLTTVLNVLGKAVEGLINQNDTINK